jgi:short-subunit dehydrogenase
MKKIKSFKGRVVVITGAASGMGRAYAQAFAKEGSLLALCDYDERGLNETISMLPNSQKLYSQTFDISTEQAVVDFALKVKEELGPPYVVINNAGIEGGGKPFWATPQDTFKNVMDVNFYGVVYGTRAFLPEMMARNEGAIINVSSIFGLAGTPNNSDYCGSKFAVRGFTESLMVELSDSNIQVHLLHPGGIRTNIARQERSRDFSQHYLTTEPHDVAQYLIKSIKQNKRRIVYGNNALKVWLATKLLPLSVVSSMIWSEMKKVIDLNEYKGINR